MISGVPSCPNIKYEKKKKKRKKWWFDCNTEKRQNRGTSGVGACNPGLPTMAAETAAPENPLVAGEADTWLGLPWPWQCLQHKKLGCSGIVHGTLAHQLLRCLWLQHPGLPCEPDNTTWQMHPPIPSLLPLSAPQWWWSLWFRGSWMKRGAYHPGAQGSHTSNTDPRGTDVIRRA